MESDAELLRRYAEEHSEAAFGELVRRHLNLVYRTALRRVGNNAYAADDVTQRVFIQFARKASTLRDRDSLAGWLYTAARFAAAELVRGEQRRRTHEQEASTMNEIERTTASPEVVNAMLDDVVSVLPPRDQDLVARHFLEGQSFVEIAASTSSTADATRMRVNRALDRLRTEFERRGIVSTAVALSATLSAQAAVAPALPEAGALAALVLQQAGLAHVASASLAAKALGALKAAPLVWSGVTVAAFLGAAATWYSLRSPTRQVELTEATVSINPPQERPAALQDITAPPGSQSTNATTSLPGTPATSKAGAGGARSFARRPEAEKNLLALLWRGHLGAAAGTRIVLGIARNGINADGIDPLLDEQLVSELPASDPRHRRVYLTRRGVKYCEMQQSDVEAYAPRANFVHKAGDENLGAK